MDTHSIISVLCVFSLTIHISLGFSIKSIYSPILSPFVEQCDSRWVISNIDGLEQDLYENVFGQDLAISVVLTALRNHITKINHKKPLVFSFHGWTGGGKTYVKDFILKHWYRNGPNSQYIKTYFAEKDFPSNDENLVYEYKMRLQKEFEETISLCPKAIFVFDEVDKYPPNVLDGIKPYIDYNSHINGYDYRKAIFILITNTGGSLLTKVALQKWQQGEDRGDFKLSDFEEPLTALSFNNGGGFYRSDLIRHHLIDYIVPFLPLEKSHVQSCIEIELRQKGVMSDRVISQVMREILEEITFEPQEHPLYASQGCRNIEAKVNIKVEEIQKRELKTGNPRRRNEL